jgi:thiamine-phosphate pyrophosphorylase
MRGLYVITPALADDPEVLHQQVKLAISGGAALIQFRYKGVNSTRRHSLAVAVQAACKDDSIPLIINDHVDLARALDADGLHLGQTDGALALARARLGQDAIIGRTCHGSEALMDEAISAGANYCAFGRLFNSNTKPEAEKLSLLALEKLIKRCPLPVVAIGGITKENGAQILDAGASMLAVCGAVFEATDIAQATYELARLFEGNI